jgi:hypothetical protein
MKLGQVKDGKTQLVMTLEDWKRIGRTIQDVSGQELQVDVTNLLKKHKPDEVSVVLPVDIEETEDGEVEKANEKGMDILSRCELKKVGGTMALQFDGETLLYAKIEPLFIFLERLMCDLREKQLREKNEKEDEGAR